MADKELALITGASSGIGADIARELADRGFDLILTARRADRLEALKQELGGRVTVHVITEDLAVPDGARSLIAKVEALGRPVSFLANNAGFGIHGNFLDHAPEQLEQMLRLNMETLTTLCWHFGRAMRAQGRGHILQVSSIGGFQPSPYYAAYCGTKAYVLYLTEGLNYELRGTGVTVTALCPGVTATEFHDVAAHPKTGLVGATTMGARPVARAGVRAALKGRSVATPGFLNWMTAATIGFVPRGVATAISAVLMR